MFSITTSATIGVRTNSWPNNPASATTERSVSGDWFRQWQSPLVATATAVGALVLSEQHGGVLQELGQPENLDSAYQGDLSELIVSSVHWLARRQHEDGGWKADSNDLAAPSDLFASILVRAAFQLTGAPAAYPDLVDRMADSIERQGGCGSLKEVYGPQHSATLLARGTSALAEVIDFRQMPSMPLETIALDRTTTRVEFWKHHNDILPAMVALGVASFHLNKPINPLTVWRRGRACRLAIEWLERQQQSDGGFVGSVPVTSIVLMSLASIGRTSQQIVRRGVEYLFANVRQDGSWLPHLAIDN